MRKMEKMISLSEIRSFLMLRAAPLALVLGMIPATSHADWIPSVLDERCAAEDVNGVSTAVRDSIEASVRRAEASIQAPTPVGDLSCLNDLMLQPLDIFSSIGGLLSSLQQGLSNLSLNLDIDVSGMICQMAAEKWAELTQGLGGLDAPLSAFSGASANPLDRLASGSFSDGGSSGLFSGFSGVLNLGNSTTDDPNYRGSIGNYVPPSLDVSQETASRPIFDTGTYLDSSEFSAEEEARIEAANRAYNEALMKNMADYMACIVVDKFEGSRLDGTNGGWYSLDAIWRSPDRTCADPLTGLPSITTTTNATPLMVTPEAQPVTTYQSPDREAGQDRPETSAPADSAAPSGAEADPATSIWDLINNPAGGTP